MPDSYDAYSQELDKQKAGLLASIAQYGSAGRQEYERTQAALTQQKQAAVQAAIQDAIRRGASPEQSMAGIEHTIGDPYDRRMADITAAIGQQTNSFNSMAANNAAYFDQSKAAIPGLRTYSQAKAAEQQAKDAFEARRLAIQERELEMREQELQGGGAGGILASLAKQFGGIGNANKYIASQSKTAVAANKFGGGDFDTGRAYDDDAKYDEFDREAGLPEGYSRGLQASQPKAKQVDKYAKATGFTDRHTANLRKTKEYLRADRFLSKMAADEKLDRTLFEKMLKQDYLNGTRLASDIRRLLTAEFNL